MSSHSISMLSRLVHGVVYAALTFSSLSLMSCESDAKKGPSESSDDPSSAGDEGDDASSGDQGEEGGRADSGHDAGKAPDSGAGSRSSVDAGPPGQLPGQDGSKDAGPTTMVDATKPPACGGPGQACCPGDACSSGCCVNDICLANGTSCGAGFGMCMDNACSGCGKAGQSCCPGRTCQPGSACGSSNMCLACGGADQRCCADGQCSAGACVGRSTSDPGTCRTGCGAKDQMCCTGEAGGFTAGGGFLGGVLNAVSNNTGMCVGDLSCLRGKCSPCGAEGEACCPGAASCDNSLECIDSKCQKCGQPGQACCAPTAANLDGCLGPLNVCQNGACTGMTCGLLNEVCCPGVPGSAIGTCSASGTFCISGSCKTCGGLGEPCCTSASVGAACSVRGAACVSGTCKMP